ncbi:MAG: hypothetical protein U0Q12_14710 [Vicinamibacterales bacterium]
MCELPECTTRARVSIGGGIFPRWNHDGTELYYLTRVGELMCVPVTRRPLTLGEATPLFRVPFSPFETVVSLYDVHPDGQRFLFLLPDTTAPATMQVILNWQELLPPAR